MAILVIATATPRVTVALLQDDGSVLAEKQWDNTRELNQQLLVVIDELLQGQSLTTTALTRIAVQTGPGHYGAIRTGIVTAMTLAQALHIPTVPLEATMDTAQLYRQAIEGVPVSPLIPIYQPQSPNS